LMLVALSSTIMLMKMNYSMGIKAKHRVDMSYLGQADHLFIVWGYMTSDSTSSSHGLCRLTLIPIL
ncbi:hypothetical protein MTR67_030746, partial [Solanum verrucosum]